MSFHLSLKTSSHVDAATAEITRLQRAFTTGRTDARADMPPPAAITGRRR